MKTVAELAKEMDVSVQTVYRKLEKINKNYTEKVGGVTYITDAGIEALTGGLPDVKQALNSVKQEEGTVEHQDDNVKHHDNGVKHDNGRTKRQVNDEVFFLMEQNRFLQEELVKSMEHSREQADKIASQADRIVSLAEQLAELMRNNQILLGAEQSRTLIPNELPEQSQIVMNSEIPVTVQNIEKPKKIWFLRLFKK